MTIIKKVREALENAKDNEFNFIDWSNEDIANDLKMYDSELEKEKLIDIIYYVKYIRGES